MNNSEMLIYQAPDGTIKIDAAITSMSTPPLRQAMSMLIANYGNSESYVNEDDAKGLIGKDGE